MTSPIRETREISGISQQALSELIGVSVATVHRWETGVSTPHPIMQEKLTRVLGALAKKLKAKETPSTELGAVANPEPIQAGESK